VSVTVTQATIINPQAPPPPLFFASRHPQFAGIQQSWPKAVTNGGVTEPLRLEAVTARMHNELDDVRQTSLSSYTCGINASWINWAWTAQKIPITRNAIKLLVNSRFLKPQPLTVECLANDVSDVTSDSARSSSMIKRLSPEEVHHAFILATYRDVSTDNAIDVP
jgi:hypothetical protein